MSDPLLPTRFSASGLRQRYNVVSGIRRTSTRPSGGSGERPNRPTGTQPWPSRCSCEVWTPVWRGQPARRISDRRLPATTVSRSSRSGPERWDPHPPPVPLHFSAATPRGPLVQPKRLSPWTILPTIGSVASAATGMVPDERRAVRTTIPSAARSLITEQYAPVSCALVRTGMAPSPASSPKRCSSRPIRPSRPDCWCPCHLR